MVSGIRSRLSSIIRYGSLPPVVLCVLYSAFVMPPFDYCDVVWCPITAKFSAKLTSLVERVHSKFLHKLPSSIGSKINSTLTECRRFHTAVQVFRSLRRQCPYLRNMFQYSKDVTGHLSRNINRLFVPRICTNFGKRSLLPWDSFMEQFTIQCCKGCYTILL